MTDLEQTVEENRDMIRYLNERLQRLERGVGTGTTSCCGAAIAELERCLADAKRNRSKEDPEWKCERWSGFLEGIRSAIYRLEMNSHNGGGLPPATPEISE